MEVNFTQVMNKHIRYFSFLILLITNDLLGQDTTVTELEANGPGETYELFAEVLGGSPLEVPDCDHEDEFRHIEEVYDETLDKYVFKFYIHKDIDTDRCGTNSDRQRNEIKTYGPSPDYLKAIEREIVTYEWLFKIDELFQPTSRFTHLFQLKVVGGDDDANPLLTITPRKSDPEKLQIIHGRGNGNYSVVKDADLSIIKGKWVRAFCKATYAEDTGKVELNLELLDGTPVLSYSNESIDMWRLGASFVRPKWGIYRSLGDFESLRDEEVYFADFKITEEGACPIFYEDADGDGLGDPNSFIYSCENPEGYVQNNVDTCLDWYEDADYDGLGNPEVMMYSCGEPEGYVANADDEDDTINNTLDVADHRLVKGIYPNPATNFIFLRGHDERMSSYLFDMGGKRMKEFKGIKLDISDLKRGVYLLKIEDGRTYPFIKN